MRQHEAFALVARRQQHAGLPDSHTYSHSVYLRSQGQCSLRWRTAIHPACSAFKPADERSASQERTSFFTNCMVS